VVEDIFKFINFMKYFEEKKLSCMEQFSIDYVRKGVELYCERQKEKKKRWWGIF
jgi:hypothetical protein